jgi:hypothetical protein
MLTSMVASAALIFLDDGYRTMSVTWPLVALFLCSGCTSPATSGFGEEYKPLMRVRSGWLLIVCVVLAVITTPAVTRLWPGRDVQSLYNSGPAAKIRETVLFGRTLTGFLVLPDDVPLPRQAPAMHASAFAQLIGNVGMERDYGSFLNLAMKKVPFAFVTGPRIGRGINQTEQVYLAPVGILTQGPAKAWRMTLDDTLRNKWIRNVVEVEPVR